VRDRWNTPKGFERAPAAAAGSVIEPARPDGKTLAVLESVLGRLWPRSPEPGWLLWMAAGSRAEKVAPRGFDEPVDEVFMLAGQVDRVARVSGGRPDVDVLGFGLAEPVRVEGPVPGSDDRVLVETSTSRATMMQLYSATEAGAGQPPAAMRYVSLVLDRYDGQWMRVERVVATRSQLHDVVMELDLASCEVRPWDALRWWTARERRPVGTLVAM
jgi:hypothetical protein